MVASLDPVTGFTTPSCTDICVVKTASPFQRGVARKMPEPPLARFDTAMKQSFGSAPNFSLNSAFVHSLMWPAPSMERRPRSPENRRPAWDTESYFHPITRIILMQSLTLDDPLDISPVE